MREIGRRIRDLRKERGYTQEQLAEKLFIGSTALCNYEKGNRSIPLEFLVHVASYFGVTVEELMGSEAKVLRSMRKMDMAEQSMAKRLILDGKEFTETEWYWFVSMVRAYRQMKG